MSDTLKKLYIEPTSRCNLNCTMCFRHTWFGETLSDLPFELFEKALDTAPESVETVFFGGMGEPLFHPRIADMVALASARGKNVELLTNGTLLTPKRSAALLDAGLDMLWVSLDSFDAEGYENIRKNSNFKLIVDNISAFNDEKTKRAIYFRGFHFDRVRRKGRLGIAFVAMKSNVHELDKLPMFASRYHVGEVNISNMIPTTADGYKEALYEKMVGTELGIEDWSDNIPAVHLPQMDWAQPDAAHALVSLVSSPVINTYISDKGMFRRRGYCRFVREGMAFVKHNGDIAPCMELLHSADTYMYNVKHRVHSHSFGNLAQSGLEDIWNGEEYTAFRERVTEFSFPSCIRCGHCADAAENLTDCEGNPKPVCGSCLWAEGIFSCP